jgi:hypothetical protein
MVAKGNDGALIIIPFLVELVKNDLGCGNKMQNVRKINFHRWVGGGVALIKLYQFLQSKAGILNIYKSLPNAIRPIQASFCFPWDSRRPYLSLKLEKL